MRVSASARGANAIRNTPASAKRKATEQRPMAVNRKLFISASSRFLKLPATALIASFFAGGCTPRNSPGVGDNYGVRFGFGRGGGGLSWAKSDLTFGERQARQG